LAELDRERREIFFLAMLEELPIAEVAETLGLNPNTVYSRVRVLRRALADFLRHENESHGGPDAP
jgi:RNA polymerase sigma-70 factor (ECF subfamily)